MVALNAQNTAPEVYDSVRYLGYVPGGLAWQPNKLNPDAVSILKELPFGAKIRSSLQDDIPEYHQGLAILWINGGPQNATKDSWVMNVYGRENVFPMIALARELSREYTDQEIRVRLKEESPAGFWCINGL